jgi:perosamine synthetase
MVRRVRAVTAESAPARHQPDSQRGETMIPVYQPWITEKERRYVDEAMTSTWISSKGAFLDRFERDFPAYIGAEHGIAAANGTVALHLAMAALGIGPGDEVIVPALTYVASVNAISYTGAAPVFVDSDPDRWNIAPDLVERAITPRTKAIEVVHLYGYPADLDPILDIASRHGLAVVEDAAEAHGAEYKGRRVGSLGSVGVFSFFGNKIVTTGEGGMLVTSDDALAERARHLRGQGVSATRTYWHDVIGFNYRMTNVAAAIGCAQLERVEETLDAKRRLAALYRQHLDGIDGVAFQADPPWARPVYWMICILVDPRLRDPLMAFLAGEGVETRPFFYPAHTLPMYTTGERFPEAERLGSSGINLPSYPTLEPDEVERVCRLIGDFMRRSG